MAGVIKTQFRYFLTEICAVVTQKNHLNETVSLSTQNICLNLNYEEESDHNFTDKKFVKNRSMNYVVILKTRSLWVLLYWFGFEAPSAFKRCIDKQ